MDIIRLAPETYQEPHNLYANLWRAVLLQTYEECLQVKRYEEKIKKNKKNFRVGWDECSLEKLIEQKENLLYHLNHEWMELICEFADIEYSRYREKCLQALEESLKTQIVS